MVIQSVVSALFTLHNGGNLSKLELKRFDYEDVAICRQRRSLPISLAVIHGFSGVKCGRIMPVRDRENSAGFCIVKLSTEMGLCEREATISIERSRKRR